MNNPKQKAIRKQQAMVDLKPLHEMLREPINAAMAEVMQRGDFVGGEALRRFEEKAAAYLGVEYAIGVGSGTDALTLALRVAGIGKDDEVITTPFSFWATAEAIHNVGARAVYVDITERDMNLDPKAVAGAIGDKTRAILPVHIFGQSADMAGIVELAEAYGLAIIEDAAQAFGASYRGRAAGSFGLAGCFSFYPSKPLGCFGDGGLITSNDRDFVERLRMLNNHGAEGHNQHRDFGYNSRLDTLQAAVLNAKLAYLDTHLSERRRLAGNYHRLLADTALQLPGTMPERDHCFAQYTVRCEHRDELKAHLAQAGIASAIHYPLPLYRQSAYSGGYGDLRLPRVEASAATCLSLPLYEGLSDQQQAGICERIVEFFR